MLFKNNVQKTNPLIAHFNGNQQKILTDDFVNSIIESNKITIPKDLTIVTFATKDIINECTLIKQLKRYNIEFYNLCELYDTPKKWKNLYKIKLINKFISNVNTKYIMVLDALDILLSEDIYKIIDIFNEMEYKIYYGSTINRYPKNELEPKNLINDKGDFKYLNSGTVIAETKYYKEFIKQCDENTDENINRHSDQFEIRKNYVLYDKDIISYDYKCELFQTVGGSNYFNLNIIGNCLEYNQKTKRED